MKLIYYFCVLLILISIGVGIYYYPHLPDRIASHWDAQGQVNGYMSKFWGIFLFPIISAACFILLIFIPKLDPLKKNLEKFRDYYDFFIFIFLLFLFYLFILTILWNIGYVFNMTVLIIPGIALFFYYIGVLLHNAKQNWFVGIRTPWTLSNEEVWNKTHKLGGILFRAVAIISLAGIIFQKYAFLIFFVPMIAVVVFLLIYSYVIFKKIKPKIGKKRKIIK